MKVYELKIGDEFTLNENSVILLFKQFKKCRDNKFNLFKPTTWFYKRYFIFERIK